VGFLIKSGSDILVDNRFDFGADKSEKGREKIESTGVAGPLLFGEWRSVRVHVAKVSGVV
jgi:hypothetical protein